ncbi:hypothetical protein TYRP_012686 [Tyrophagus putrescentiae]|nr:hypothetical protein TYRP_012686 [Tyrophagus putrescentiae]
MKSSKLDDHQLKLHLQRSSTESATDSGIFGFSGIFLYLWFQTPSSKQNAPPTSSLAGPASSFLLAASSLLCLISLSTADDGTINFGTPLNNAATLNETRI